MKKVYLQPLSEQILLPEESVLYYTSPDGKIKPPTNPQSLSPSGSAPKRLSTMYI